ncbi:MAG: phosphate ABC transporter permease subunit PstC [Acidothermus sp.]|nr:phosphate ABC transporter permease subunit PstC [Acidothermus sp.]
MRVGTRETHDRATPRAQTRRRAIGDVLFERSVWLAACAVLALLIAVAAFLVWRSIPAIRQDSANFLTTRTWLPDDTPPVFGVAAIAFGTALSATVALVLAVPVAIGSAIFVTQYVPPRVGVWLGYCLDLLAAVPSVVYGLWGMLWLVPAMTPIQHGLATTLGFLPFFADPQGLTRQASRSIFVVGIVLAAMIIPIIAAVTREVIRQVDPGLREAAWALGATRWEMVRIAILPASKLGIAGAVLLGLGRALGETIAVALVLGTSFAVDFHLLVFGKNTIAANIATQFAEAGSLGRSALIASGLVLFAMTMLTTLLARAIIYRSGSRERSAFA